MSYISNDNGSRQVMFLVVMSLLIFLSVIAVTLRFYCRIIHIRHVGRDDYLMLVALAFVIGMGIMNGFHVSYGTGRHSADLPLLEIIVPTLQHWYTFQLIYPLALFFIKASILSLYHRIFPDRKFRIVVWIVSGFVAVYTVVVVFVNAFECPDDPTFAWDPGFPEGCNNLSAAYFSMASINIFTDIVILILPLRVLASLNLHRRKKWVLVGIFLTGSIAVIASIVRLNALYIYTVTEDVSWDAIYILLWSQIEVNVAIITASTPALRPMFKNVFHGSSVFSRSRGISQGDYYGSARYSRQTRRRTGGGGTAPGNSTFELYSQSGNPERSQNQVGIAKPSTSAEGSSFADTGSDEENRLENDEFRIMKTVDMSVNYGNSEYDDQQLLHGSFRSGRP